MASSSSSSEDNITFRSQQGTRLAGILRQSSAKDAVILCHGLGSHKNGFHLKSIAEALDEHGVSSLRFDFPGCADSEGDFKYANIPEEAGCMQSAYDYLTSQNFKVIGLLGHSKSGSGVLVHAAQYQNIPAVVVCSGRYDHKKGIKERFGDDVFERIEREGGIPQQMKTSRGVQHWVFDKQDLEARMSLDMHDVCSKINPATEILILHGTDDETIPVGDARKLANELQGSKLVVIDGANHSFTDAEHAKRVVNESVEFLTSSQQR